MNAAVIYLGTVEKSLIGPNEHLKQTLDSLDDQGGIKKKNKDSMHTLHPPFVG